MKKIRIILLCFVMLIMASTAVNAAMISQYQLNSNYTDSGTIPRDGTVVGAAAIDTTAGAGPLGTTGYLDLSGGYVDLPDYAGPGWLGGGVTITAWVKKDDPMSATEGSIFSQAWNSPANGTISLRATSAGIYAQELVNVSANTGPYAGPDQWFHVALVAPGVTGTHKIFINGTEVASTWMPWVAWPGNVYKNMGGAAQIGAWGGGNNLLGGIADLRIYADELLDSAAITEVMNSVVPEPATLALLGLGGLLLRGRKKN